MWLESSAFRDHENLPEKFTRENDNVNPPLEIFDVPENARSLVLIMDNHDQSDPSGEWTHWVVWNIDPQTKKIHKNSVPDGAEIGVNSFGKVGYEGPSPLFKHLYRFRLYALDVKIDLKKHTNVKDVVKAMQGHKLEKATLTCFFDRDFGTV